MESSIKEKIAKSLERAGDALIEAELLLSNEHYAGAVSRSYYVVFHAACAILLTKNLEYSKHSAVISAFGYNFVRSGLIDKNYHKIAIDAYEVRQLAEYDIFRQINKKFAEKIFNEAKEFLVRARDFAENEMVEKE